jgi:environmental stress-induced protein Ves
LCIIASVPPALRIIRKSSFVPKPWKNGGGVTHEALRMPAEGDSFEWRVSVAHIEASGPFSDFTGYERNMVLLKGEGFKLGFPDGSEHSLKRVGELVRFDGALALDCSLLDGPCVDLNLMVAKAQAATAEVEWLAGTKERCARAAPGESTLIFGIEAALAVTIEAKTLVLEPWDLGCLANGSAQVRLLDSRAGANPSAVFFATISH